jgi:hypothetical protein
MTAKISGIGSSRLMQGNETVRAEMQTFVEALASYADRFAANPRLSFEQHRNNLMLPMAGMPAASPRKRVDQGF